MIELLNPFIKPTQPTVYDTESLTILEQMRKIIDKINDVVSQFNNIETTNQQYKIEFTNLANKCIKQMNELVLKLESENANFKYEIREKIEMIEKVNNIVYTINKQYEEMKTLAEKNKEIIESNNIVTNDTLNSVINVNRKFKPTLGIFMDLTPGGGDFISENTIKTNLNLLTSQGIESLVIQPWFEWDSTNSLLTMKGSINQYKFIIQECIKRNIKISCFKIHTYLVSFTTLESNNQLDTFFTQYKALVESVLNELVQYRDYIENVIVLNECNLLYKTGSSYKDFVLEVVQLSKDKLFTTGISTMGCKESLMMDIDIQKKVDKFFFNCYPKMSYKKELTTVEDTTYSWENSYEFKCLKELKRLYPDKEIIMSETGCNDYWLSIVDPGDWQLMGDVKTGGKAPSLMLEGLFKSSIQNYITEVWWCYWQSLLNEPCKQVIKNYIGGK